MNENRILVSVKKIDKIEPLTLKNGETARSVLAFIGGWKATVGANEFNVGDPVVFAEPDSVFPVEERWYFLERHKYRIKTQKYGELNIEKAPLLRRVILVDAKDEFAYPGVYDFHAAMEEGRAMPDDEFIARQKEFTVKDLAYIIHTSGSTGFPKGVMLSHLNVVENSYAMMNQMSLNENDKMCVQIQLFHTFGSVASAMPSIPCTCSFWGF